jgi:hypothetical protein
MRFERLNDSTTLENDNEVERLREVINDRLKEKARDPYDWLDTTGLSTIERQPPATVAQTLETGYLSTLEKFTKKPQYFPMGTVDQIRLGENYADKLFADKERQMRMER